MSPFESASLAAGTTAAFEVAVGAALLAWLGLRRRIGGRGGQLARRLRWAAAPLLRVTPTEGPAAGDVIFRAGAKRTWFSGLWTLVEARYPLIDGRRGLAAAVGTAVAMMAGCWLSMWFLRVPSGWWTLPLTWGAGVGGAVYVLGWMQARQEAEFVRRFPEVVDQIVRLAAAGVPSQEALSVVADDSPHPVAPILRNVCDGLLAGLEADVVLRTVSERVRLAEFTMFAAVIRLQQHSGGGVSTAFTNLAATLRERRRVGLKAHASTAQTRLTLLVLSGMPVAVLLAEHFIAPHMVAFLFDTPEGNTVLQVGIGLIVFGLLVARSLAARFTR